MNAFIDSFQKTINPHKKCSRSIDIGSISSFLHNYVTVYFLFGCFLLVSSQQHFGNPIQCLMDNYLEEPAIREHAINNYCFMSTTYSVVNSSATALHDHVYDGVLPDTGSARHHAYYQWVPLVLLLQAALFMVPYWLWKGCEGGLVKRLVTSLDEDLETRIPRLKRPTKVKRVVEYFYARLGHSNRISGLTWILCDFLALLNVVANFFLTDALFDGKFMKFGLTSLQMMAAEPSHTIIFPLLTKCSFHAHGSSGSIQKFDSICVMTLNVVNEKVYILLWGWFFLLANLTVLFIFTKFARIAILRYWPQNYIESTIGVPTMIPGHELQKCVASMSFGDCVLFHILAKNMRPMTYRSFVEYLACKIDNKRNEKFL